MRGDAELIAKIAELEKRLDNLAQPEKGWTPHFFDEPLTNTDFDGDSFSDVAALTIIQNTSWSTTIPADAKALAVRVAARDSGSAGSTGLFVKLFSTAAATNPSLTCWPTGILNDAFAETDGTVPCTNGDIWYTVNASGASTMDIFILVMGYWA